jgi:hypothetical protein
MDEENFDSGFIKSATINQVLPCLLPLDCLQCGRACHLPAFFRAGFYPPPASVLLAGIHLTQTGELPLHFFEIGLGLLNGLSALADRLLDASVQMVRNIFYCLRIQKRSGKFFRDSFD